MSFQLFLGCIPNILYYKTFFIYIPKRKRRKEKNNDIIFFMSNILFLIQILYITILLYFIYNIKNVIPIFLNYNIVIIL
jgi:hypothetical protein